MSVTGSGSSSWTKAAPAEAATSPSPVASTTTRARIALRPALFSTMTPVTAGPSVSVCTT